MSVMTVMLCYVCYVECVKYNKSRASIVWTVRGQYCDTGDQARYEGNVPGTDHWAGHQNTGGGSGQWSLPALVRAHSHHTGHTENTHMVSILQHINMECVLQEG